MTERDESLHVVFGATGAIGSTVVTELVHAGRDVRAVSRGGQAPDAARGVAADASDPAQAARDPGQWPQMRVAVTGENSRCRAPGGRSASTVGSGYGT